MHYRIISIKNISTLRERKDKKYIQRKKVIYNNLVKASCGLIFVGDRVDLSFTTSYITDYRVDGNKRLITITTLNSIYEVEYCINK